MNLQCPICYTCCGCINVQYNIMFTGSGVTAWYVGGTDEDFHREQEKPLIDMPKRAYKRQP